MATAKRTLLRPLPVRDAVATLAGEPSIRGERAVRWRIKLRITIAVGIVFITVALAASLVSLNYLTSAKAIRAFTRALLDPAAAWVAERSENFLDACGGSAGLASELLASTPEAGRLDAVDAIGFALLLEHPELSYVQFGDPEGGFQLVTRSPGGGIDSKRIVRTGARIESQWSRRDPGAPFDRPNAGNRNRRYV